MGLFSRFEDKAEDLIEGSGSSKYGGIEPVKLAKRAYKEMQREKMVGVGHEYAPTLYNVLVSPEDDRHMSGMYPSLAGEIETYLTGRAESSGLVFDCPPLVRFIVDEGLKQGRFDIIAESVSPSIIEELRREEMEHYGIQEHGHGGGAYGGGYRDDANMQPVDSYAAEGAPRGYADDEYERGGYGRDEFAHEAPAAFDPLAPADMQEAVYTPSPEEIAQAHPERDMRPQPEPVPEPAAAPARPQPRPQPLRPQPASAQAADVQPQAQARPAAQPQAQAQPAAAHDIPAAAPAIRSYLYDPQTRRRFPLDADRVVVGREISCDIQVNDPSVSRHHAEVMRTERGWAIRDTGSTNGTSVNDAPVSQSRIYNGDRIRLGNTQLVFQEG